VAVLAVSAAGCERPASPRHVLLISIDTLRADRLGAYGYRRPTSPFLDELARRGRLFEHAFVNTHGTTSSHTTILSGLYQETHGVGLDGIEGGVVARTIPAEVPMVQELLGARGYFTIGVTEGGNVGGAFGFARGFDRFDDRSRGIGQGTSRLLAEVRSRLAAEPERPLFAFLHTYQVHSPYRSPLATRRLMGIEDDRRGPDNRFLLRHARRAHQLPPGMLRRLSDLYDASVRFTDDSLRALFADLAAAGFLQHALVVVTADHGEELGEHGGLLHRDLLYDELLRVPLLLDGPGIDPARPRQLVSSIDIAPTLLAWAGAPLPAALPGVSLLDPRPGERAAVIAQYAHRRFALRTARWKLIENVADGGVELYDLAADPGERRDLAAVHPQQRQRLQAALAAWRQRIQPPGTRGTAVVLDPEQEAALRALGYLDF
jgi:arylsulfatase A-like enzyme